MVCQIPFSYFEAINLQIKPTLLHWFARPDLFLSWFWPFSPPSVCFSYIDCLVLKQVKILFLLFQPCKTNSSFFNFCLIITFSERLPLTTQKSRSLFVTLFLGTLLFSFIPLIIACFGCLDV